MTDRILVKVKTGKDRGKRVLINIRHIGSSNSISIVKHGNLESENFDKIYCVFDKNPNDNIYIDAMSLPIKSNVVRINSAPSYEFWLILHFTPSNAGFLNNDKLFKKLEELIRKETGNRKFKYPKSHFPKELSEIVISKLSDAIKNAKKIEKLNSQDGSGEPCTKIYQLN